jgi:hypothetical protein
MDFTKDFRLFCIYFINVSMLYLRHPFNAYFGNKLCLIHSPPPFPPLVYNRLKAEFSLFLEHLYF